MDARPRRHDAREYHPIVEEAERIVNGSDGVEERAVRLREEGHVFTGEVLVAPTAQARADGLLERLDDLAGRLLGLE